MFFSGTTVNDSETIGRTNGVNHRQSISVAVSDLYVMSTVDGLKSTDVCLWCTNCTSMSSKKYVLVYTNYPPPPTY